MPSLRTLLLAFLFAVAVSPANAAETYRNPIIDDTLADPAVVQHDGTYYLYATGEVDGDNGYRVYTSSDLVNWERGPVVFRPGDRHMWAPDVWRDPDSGRFYLYYTANRTIGVADADGPLGPFTGRRKLFGSAIDAHLFRDDDGRLYLYVVQLPGFRITVQAMASPTESAGEPKVIIQPESDWETRAGHVTEGPWMIKHDGRYYLMYSGSGASTPDYAVGYATSDSPLGPFTRARNNPIIQRSEGLFGPGHGCAIRDNAGQWWHVYHQKRTARVEWGRFVCLDPLWFDEQGLLHGRATRGTEQRAPAAGETLCQRSRSSWMLSQSLATNGSGPPHPSGNSHLAGGPAALWQLAKAKQEIPQRYDRFHERGCEVLRETEDFDRIWVGTETRDYVDARWGGTPQYEAE